MLSVNLKEVEVFVKSLRMLAEVSYFGQMKEGFIGCCDRILEWVKAKADYLDSDIAKNLDNGGK